MFTGPGITDGADAHPEAEIGEVGIGEEATYSAFPDPDPGPGPVLFWEVFPVALVANLGADVASPVTVLFRLSGFSGRPSRSGSTAELRPGQFRFIAAPRDSGDRGFVVQPGDYVLQVVVKSVGIDKNVSNNVVSVPIHLGSR